MIKIFSALFITCLGLNWLQSGPEKPEDNRFTQVVLAEGLDEPMEMAFLPGDKVIVVERKGGVKIIDEKTKEVLDAGFIEVNTKYTNKEGRTREAEEGLMGVTVDPDFKDNHWVYLYYADPKSVRHVLSRFELKDDVLDMATEKEIIDVKTQREECCHTGGGMTWDRLGNLYLTVGNNTVNPRSGASNLNEAPGHENEDDQRAPGNSNDLRGKILRIHPEKDGSYTIPQGNLFAPGTPHTRPEIYTMGHRNAWRVSVDSKTGYIYWGEVGPDASKDSVWGSNGYDEFNQAKKAGFFGWPYVVGNNYPYARYNSEDGTYGELYDPNHLVNNSVNNTGIKELPVPVPAFLWYPYGQSEEFPLLGTGGRSATGGPVYRFTDFETSPRPWPEYYEGKWLITEFMRGWIIAVTMDKNGNYVSMERVLPDMNFSSAIDMKFGPSGDMYVLQYGSAWFRGNDNSRLVKIEYNAGNRKPMAELTADVTSGNLPLSVNLSAKGSNDYDDYDQGKLDYEWTILNAKKKKIANLSGENVNYIFKKAGNYQAVLEVKDTKGGSNSRTINITAGNQAPTVDLSVDIPNKTFYFDEKPINYTVSVNDKEDGSTADKIKPEEVAVTFDFLPQGYDPIQMAANQKNAEDMASYAVGRSLIESSDCKSCHQYTTASIGPSYLAVSEKYPKTRENMNYLVKKIKEGGSGVWGEHGMSGHPALSDINAQRMVDYIFSLKKDNKETQMGLTGSVNPKAPSYENTSGSFVLRAYYKDKGAKKTTPLVSESTVLLRPNTLSPKEVDFSKSAQIINTAGYSFSLVGDKSYAGYKNIDMTSIGRVSIAVQGGPRSAGKGGSVEMHLDSPTGPIFGVSNFVIPKAGGGRPPQGVSFSEWQKQNSSVAEIKATRPFSGKHDVYFIFRNPNAKETDILMQLSDITFLQ